jgi:hypothetical protein
MSSSAFQTFIPQSVLQVKEALESIFQNVKHVRSIEVDDRTSHIEIRLDGMAHFGGHNDMAIPVKTDKLDVAHSIIDRLWSHGRVAGHAQPSPADAQDLFDIIEQN